LVNIIVGVLVFVVVDDLDFDDVVAFLVAKVALLP